MATSRLKIYNGALLLLGERKLASLSEDREPRRLLDEVYDDGGIEYCLEQGQWQFAMRVSKLTYEASVTPQFGLRRAFTRPTDWVIASRICHDEYFRSPVIDYRDVTDYIFADVDELYVQYVSKDTTYGLDFSRWPPAFTEYVKAYFASRIVIGLKGDDKDMVDGLLHPKRGILARARLIAMNRDAIGGPPAFRPHGSWVGARGGRGRGPMGDGGNSGSLIG